MRRDQHASELPQLIDLPTGNVRVLPPPPAGDHTQSWVIHDGDGVVLEPTLESRAEALRYMCRLALRGISLPLTLFGPNGEPTGDRLA